MVSASLGQKMSRGLRIQRSLRKRDGGMRARASVMGNSQRVCIIHKQTIFGIFLGRSCGGLEKKVAGKDDVAEIWLGVLA